MCYLSPQSTTSQLSWLHRRHMPLPLSVLLGLEGGHGEPSSSPWRPSNIQVQRPNGEQGSVSWLPVALDIF